MVDTIGDTPCIRVNTLAPDHVRLYVKAEFFNPAASVKDRLAIGIIEDAERRGDLKPGQTVVEATSGNTGIGLAMVCAAKGYPLVVTMAESFSIERRRLMRFLGAKVVLTPRAAKGFGMYQKAVELAEANGWFLARQFETGANAAIHESTTAREILADFDGERLDYWVTGYGTGGTVTGVARVLRKERPETKIILSEPANAQIVGSGTAQERTGAGSPAESHPAFEPHPIQGWTPDFIPLVLQEAIDHGYYRPVDPGFGAGRHRVGSETRPRRRYFHRRLRRIDLRGGDGHCRKGGAGFGHLVHAAGYRRTLSVIASIRGDRGGHVRRRNRAFAVHAGLPHARLRARGVRQAKEALSPAQPGTLHAVNKQEAKADENEQRTEPETIAFGVCLPVVGMKLETVGPGVVRDIGDRHPIARVQARPYRVMHVFR